MFQRSQVSRITLCLCHCLFVGQFMSHHQSDQMSHRSQVSRIAPKGSPLELSAGQLKIMSTFTKFEYFFVWWWWQKFALILYLQTKLARFLYGVLTPFKRPFKGKFCKVLQLRWQGLKTLPAGELEDRCSIQFEKLTKAFYKVVLAKLQPNIDIHRHRGI